MTKQTYNRTKYACFLTSLSTAVTGNLPPLLFLTFREMYGISFSLLGFLVVLNFGTQLLLDLTFSFFSHKFQLDRAVRMTPVVMTAGLILFALTPVLFPGAPYAGLAIGTVIFSAGSGLAEVLISPTVAAIPSDEPDKLMSRLHSSYAWGLLLVVAFATGFLTLFGQEHWQMLTLILTVLPAASAILMALSPIPPMETQEKASGALGLFLTPTTLLYVAGIFLGGASECTMSQWCSGYLETALGLNKALGDLCGMAMFGAMLGLGRSLYGRFGRNIRTILFLGSTGAFLCYLTAVISPYPMVGLFACALTGFCVSMLWPGSLIAVAEAIPHGGVALYALMAMGGDLGASVCPQAVGLITDAVIASPSAAAAAVRLGLTAEQFGMKAGMAFAALFPLAGAVLFFCMKKAADRQGTGDTRLP